MPPPYVIRLFTPYFMNGPNKLECLSAAGLSSLVLWLWVRPEPIWVEHPSRVFLLALLTNIRLGWEGLTETNTLAYLAVKSFITLAPASLKGVLVSKLYNMLLRSDLFYKTFLVIYSLPVPMVAFKPVILELWGERSTTVPQQPNHVIKLLCSSMYKYEWWAKAFDRLILYNFFTVFSIPVPFNPLIWNYE